METLHKMFYSRLKPRCPWFPTSVARVSRGLRVKVIKIRLSNGWILDRDMVGALNIGLRALASDGSPVAFPSTEPHGVWVKLVNPHQGLAQTTELKIFRNS